jgi:hypothetical protein
MSGVTLVWLALLLSASAAAVADDPVTVRIYNDDPDDIVVNVYDLNTRPKALIATQRINGFAWIPIFLTASAAGKGHLQVIARTADPDFPRCGYLEERGLQSDSAVFVSATSNCRK